MISFAAAALLVSSILIIPFTLTFEEIPKQISTRSFLAIVYLGVMPTAVASILLVRIVQTAGPTFYSQANYQVPVWSIVFGAIILNETLQIHSILAFLLILAGLLIAQSKSKVS